MSSLAKTVSFSANSPTDQPAPVPSGSTEPSPRRSSIKLGSLPISPPPETYKHADPLLRRLRLKDSKGNRVNLEKEFKPDIKLVGFLFGAAWSASTGETYRLTQRFAERYSKRIRFVYVSIDETENGFHSATKDKPWTSMEWNDGSNPSESDRSDLSLPQPSEPFLLATEPDLEATFHLTDPTGSLYLRPYSRVFLAEKFQVFGVPQLVIYNIEKQEVLTKHARFSKLQMTDDGQEAEKTISDWEQGVSSSFTLSDLIYAVRWSLGLSVLAVSYLLAVHVGGMDDVMSKLSSQFTKSYLGIE